MLRTSVKDFRSLPAAMIVENEGRLDGLEALKGRYLLLFEGGKDFDKERKGIPFDNLVRALNLLGERAWRCIAFEIVSLHGIMGFGMPALLGYALVERQEPMAKSTRVE